MVYKCDECYSDLALQDDYVRLTTAHVGAMPNGKPTEVSGYGKPIRICNECWSSMVRRARAQMRAEREMAQ